jgi:hypothetical protein
MQQIPLSVSRNDETSRFEPWLLFSVKLFDNGRGLYAHSMLYFNLKSTPYTYVHAIINDCQGFQKGLSLIFSN